ncbi:aldehyde:ferredoxin oxidoreductase [candidate division MSBL1 archaeon SCGC-AAA261G05]|uniref:Aldehyde:ferredoxin oxidoreductase n=2 Tax=candidate division MSBL1 TaxID=215777 RepID=A0A133VAN6_9EURY|nr:aldehyde:ferredoxin oxidoreductase [candidate division MSBL1 archaeon SCGC-AAA261G05]KXB05065.1 aldehyde:ferredoxin oxidoreductase [candidate division MSBL1 archaeon SCGC-AAA261O19]
MLGGYNDKILHVDLSKEETSVEEPDDDFYRRYLGGKSLALYYLLKDLEPDVDPLEPDNLLIFAPGIITGSPLPGTARFTTAAKSPLTGGFGGSEAGGFFGPELKLAGYDAVIIKGKAENPVYLWIHDGEVEIRDASKLWGKTGKETQEGIREELEDDRIRVALIGPAGEKLVRFACITNELKHANGRGGLGAVMGSKNLKAVAVRGTKQVELKDPDKVKSLTKWFAENYMEKGDTSGLHNLGTPILINVHDELGALPTRNFHEGSFEGAEKISGETIDETYNIGQKACFSCPVACKRVVKVDEPYEVDPAYGGSEYETLSSLGSNCGVDNLPAVLKAGEICNAYTMDTISTGMSIAFAMECFENDILTKEDTDGLELKFGNGEAMLKMVEKIAKREGLGDILAEGVKRAAQKIGNGAEKFALHVKGRELPMHEPRLKAGVGLGYAVAPIGADHTQMEHDPVFAEENPMLEELSPIGILEPVESQDTGPRKARLFKYLQHWWTLGDCVGLCIFSTSPARVWRIPHVAQMVNAVTGWDMTIWELMKAGERCDTMARAFNLREGFTREDDWIPDRFFEPLEGGPLKGDKLSKDEFKQAIARYYQMMGWDENGVPTKTKLAELDVEWVADELKK